MAMVVNVDGGERGCDGVDGRNGLKGLKGPKGPKGLDDLNGLHGPNSIMGYRNCVPGPLLCAIEKV